jgi:hypothetical protein
VACRTLTVHVSKGRSLWRTEGRRWGGGGWVGVGFRESRWGSRWMRLEFHTASSTPGCWPPARTPSFGATPTSGTGPCPGQGRAWACPGTVRVLNLHDSFVCVITHSVSPHSPVRSHHLPGPTCLHYNLWSIPLPTCDGRLLAPSSCLAFVSRTFFPQYESRRSTIVVLKLTGQGLSSQ